MSILTESKTVANLCQVAVGLVSDMFNVYFRAHSITRQGPSNEEGWKTIEKRRDIGMSRPLFSRKIAKKKFARRLPVDTKINKLINFELFFGVY